MPGARTSSTIVIRGAREHNLKGFDLEIPRGSLTVVTGVSGSGKSSLAFDTLLREGQRRFLELMPSFARQFAGGFRRPEVRGIDGLGPAIAVGQNVSLGNPRSTVGTMTEVWDLLRLLYARLGEAPPGVTPSRGLFAWNGEGACPACKGLGLEDRLDPDLLVADPAKDAPRGRAPGLDAERLPDVLAGHARGARRGASRARRLGRRPVAGALGRGARRGAPRIGPASSFRSASTRSRTG